jgi:hypothetical protein
MQRIIFFSLQRIMEFSSYIKLQIAFLFFLHECGILVGVESSRTRKSLRELSQTKNYSAILHSFIDSLYLLSICHAISIKCMFNIR